MANKNRGERTITLIHGDDEKEYTLCYDLNAVADFEDRMGFGIGALGDKLAGVSVIRTGLMSGLQKHHRKQFRSVEVVGACMDPDRLTEYGEAFADCIAIAMGADPDEVENTETPEDGDSPPVERAEPSAPSPESPESGTGKESSSPQPKPESQPQTSGA